MFHFFILYCRYNIIYFIIQNFKHGFLMFSFTYIWLSPLVDDY